ncbi:uncharacterized protein PGTG_20614 [Puccinia graminis f. sp. tritici CRL 75-36-700-3]|uniref:Uncharacterized protein n=1 Tax=Puccinia graminis f. sp. tritici (strain CRL 75-36-700-3 / race SCCL) TaxID=418459 RepID=H6QNU9_PUCGT|nr:uncharacterized protein PGTG_20614 [Puccinia graminis f. sp. tritici CRL 75-36-700-3]EHS62491.1 hypothetical protein PGTG_20614 [Puccinia graminis f. sp. tritici CRL 75-36-700-3]
MDLLRWLFVTAAIIATNRRPSVTHLTNTPTFITIKAPRDISQAPTQNTAFKALLGQIKIHPRYQDERTQTLIKLTIRVIILAGLYEWLRTFKTPYNNAPFTGRDYVELWRPATMGCFFRGGMYNC